MESDAHTKAARYLLFTDGRGVFVPNDTQVLVIPEGDGETSLGLAFVSLDRLSEGDLIALQKRPCGDLLEAVSAQYGFDRKLEESCDWRPALERLLLTVEPEKVAEEMLDCGAKGIRLALSIRNWADGTVYGPARKPEFCALVEVLNRYGKLPNHYDVDEYAASRWHSLRELRSLRQRVGQNIQTELIQSLADALEHLPSLSEGEAINTREGAVFRGMPRRCY